MRVRMLLAPFALIVSIPGPGSRVLGGQAPPPGLVKPPRPFEKDGVLVSVRSISLTNQRSLRFDPAGGFDSGRLHVRLGVQLKQREPQILAGFENLAAKDELGNFLVSEQRWSSSGGGLENDPGEWYGSASFSGAHPDARRLAWLEGDLVAFRIARAHQVDVPLPTGGKSVRQPLGESVIEIVSFAPTPGDVDGEWTLSARVYVPREAGLRPGATDQLLLVGKSGKTYRPRRMTGGGSSTHEGVAQQLTAGFRPVDEPLVGARFSLLEKRDPYRLLSFRIQEIPLPPESPFAPRAVRPPGPFQAAPPRPGVPVPAGPAPERAYREAGGGILVNQVRLQSRPAGEGTLSVGLSAKQGAEWSSIHWMELEVNAAGQARVPDLKPGRYRLLRVYRPAVAPALSDRGRWAHEEVEIDVVAGKEVTPPPLEWQPEGPVQRLPKPGGRQEGRP